MLSTIGKAPSWQEPSPSHCSLLLSLQGVILATVYVYLWRPNNSNQLQWLAWLAACKQRDILLYLHFASITYTLVQGRIHSFWSGLVNKWLVYAPQINEWVVVEPLLAMKTTKSLQLNTNSKWLKSHGINLADSTTTQLISSTSIHYQDMTHWHDMKQHPIIAHYEMASDHRTCLIFWPKSGPVKTWSTGPVVPPLL